MRETCARVLAAALMTGAIATVVGMSALFDTPQEVGRPFTAPRSSLQRSVRVKVRPASHHAPALARLVSVHTSGSSPVRRAIVTRRLVVRRTVVAQQTRPQPRQLAAVQPKPAPVVQPAPAPPEPQPATAPPAPPAPVESGKEHPKGQGKDGGDQGADHADDHGHGHGHEHGQGHDEHED